MMQKDNEMLIAFVCTGNTCRSVMAEGIFNKLAKEKGKKVRAESFGISAVDGISASKNALEACKEIGVDISNKTSHSLRNTDLTRYSMFYCMTENHYNVLRNIINIPESKLRIMNIADPYGFPIDVYRKCCMQICKYITEIIDLYEN